jgi:predicted RNA-binding Zn-ribbon protein involved in translation (DUF1610 family)
MSVLGEVLEPVARKRHVCFWCGERIAIGEKHARWAWADCGSVATVRVHAECRKAWDGAAADNGGWYEADPHEHTRGCACEKGRCECREYEQTLNDVLRALGYTTRPSRFLGQKEILRDGELLVCGSSYEVLAWLRSRGEVDRARYAEIAHPMTDSEELRPVVEPEVAIVETDPDAGGGR